MCLIQFSKFLWRHFYKFLWRHFYKLLTLLYEKNVGEMKNIFSTFFYWCAPFGYLYFSYFSIMNQNCVQKLILAWLWHHFHLTLHWTGIKHMTFRPLAECSTPWPQLSLHLSFLLWRYDRLHFWRILSIAMHLFLTANQGTIL